MRLALGLVLCLAPALHAQEADRFAWGEDRPRFRKAEYVGTGLALAGSAAAFFFIPHPTTPAWKGQILFDKGARNSLRARSESGRARATKLSDMLSFPLVGYAVLDGPISAGFIGGNKDTAIQLSLIGLEVFAVTELLNLTVSAAIRRERPEANVCDPNGNYDSHCARSFWSGHTANAFAAASLVCSEHQALPLYGGKADGVACGSALAVASAVGVLRIVANDHHASDVLIGAAAGGAIGYLMPNFLHFRSKRPSNKLGYLIPNISPGGGGLTYLKTW